MEYKIEIFKPEVTNDGVIINHTLLDNKNDFHFSALKVNDKDIFSHEYDDFKKILKIIIKDYGSIANKFVTCLDMGEAFLSTSKHMFEKSHPNLDLIFNEFKNNNIHNKLVWRSNGVNPEFKTNMKFEPITNFLGTNIHTCFDIKHRKFTHTFLSLYRGYRPIREEFHCFLEQSGIINKTLYSYNAEFNNTEPWTYDYSVSLEDKSVTAPMVMYPGEYFKTTFCSLVYESYWDIHTVFFTEKINKCLLTGHPFVVISSPKYLSYLKKIGFKTFDKWWDESYDNIHDNRDREIKIKQLITEISKWSIEKCEEVYQQMIPILKHNQNNLKEIASNRNEYGYSLLKFQTNII